MNQVLEEQQAVQKVGSKRFSKFAARKKATELDIGLRAKAAKLRPELKSVYVTFLHVRKDRRVDPDNMIGGAQKMVLDGLRRCGVLEGDGWKHISGLYHCWVVTGGTPGILVALGPQLLTEERMIEEWTNYR